MSDRTHGCHLSLCVVCVNLFLVQRNLYRVVGNPIFLCLFKRHPCPQQSLLETQNQLWIRIYPWYISVHESVYWSKKAFLDTLLENEHATSIFTTLSRRNIFSCWKIKLSKGTSFQIDRLATVERFNDSFPKRPRLYLIWQINLSQENRLSPPSVGESIPASVNVGCTCFTLHLEDQISDIAQCQINMKTSKHQNNSDYPLETLSFQF